MPPSELEQVILNLVVNASDAMKGKGQLFIQVSSRYAVSGIGFVLPPDEAERYVILEIKDSGKGMSHEEISRIFEPFFTTKTTGSSPGTGLGLSTVHTIAARHGLGITVESNVGEGTRFRIVLPAASEKTTKEGELP
jgi:signal transduction histidine kinase